MTVIKRYIFLLLATLPLLNCDNELKSSSQNSINVMLGNEKPILIDNQTIRLKAYYYASSTFTGHELVPKNLFTFNMDEQTANDALFVVKEISTKRIQQSPEPISLFVLIDKRANLGFSKTPYELLEKELTNFYLPRTNYELNIGAFATQNTNFNSFTVASPRFDYIDNINYANRAFMFDATKNGGIDNLIGGIDSTLAFIARRATFAKRAILVITDYKSTIGKLTDVDRIATRAKQLNTSINFYNISFPDFTNIAHQRLASRTGGVHISQLTSTVGLGSEALIFPAFHDFLSGVNYYESIIEIKTTSSLFVTNSGFIIPHEITCFDQKEHDILFFYEK